MAETVRFTLQQRVTPLVNRYVLQKAYADGAKGSVLARAEDKRFSMRTHVTFYADEAQTSVIFGFSARKGLQHGGGYDVTDADGQPIGQFRKDHGKSLLRSTWHLSTHDGVTAVGQERSLGVAIARRVINLISDVDPLLFHFEFVTGHGEVVLTSERERSFRDHYKVTIPVLTSGFQLDWRLGAAMAVALDLLQGR